MVQDSRKDIVYVDPKGLVIVGTDDPRIQVHTTIKELESSIAPPVGEVIGLHSYILSRTNSKTVTEMWGLSKEEITARNVLFLDGSNYIDRIFEKVFLYPLQRTVHDGDLPLYPGVCVFSGACIL